MITNPKIAAKVGTGSLHGTIIKGSERSSTVLPETQTKKGFLVSIDMVAERGRDRREVGSRKNKNQVGQFVMGQSSVPC